MDVKNFTAFSFNANIYTVAEEEQSLWEQFKAIAEDPSEAMGFIKFCRMDLKQVLVP